MNKDFELKNITKTPDEETNTYVISFSDGVSEKEIALAGSGVIKEVAKV